MQNDVKKLSELIMNYLDKVGLFEQSKVLEVYSSWASIVGEKQAAHSKLIDIKHQTAVIEVDHPGWSQQICETFKKDILNWRLRIFRLLFHHIMRFLINLEILKIAVEMSLISKKRVKKLLHFQYSRKRR